MNKIMIGKIREFHQQAIEYTMENAGRRGQKSSDFMCATKFAELLINDCANLLHEIPNDERLKKSTTPEMMRLLGNISKHYSTFIKEYYYV